jgi:hypothetical protein
MLEDASIKLSAVASSLSTVSARAMLEAMVAGQRDPAVLAERTERATREIAGTIENIHAGSAQAAAAIADIVTRIADMEAQQTTIAGAVEEQSATARAMSEAADVLARSASTSAGAVDGVQAAASATGHPYPRGRRPSRLTTCPGLLEKGAGDDHAPDLVSALVDLGDLGVAHHPLDREVLRVAGPTEERPSAPWRSAFPALSASGGALCASRTSSPCPSIAAKVTERCSRSTSWLGPDPLLPTVST